MAKGLYLAGAGMIARQKRFESLAQNIANTSTPGYRASRSFANVLEGISDDSASLRRVERNQRTWIDQSQGPVEHTNRPTDVALQGPGFFSVSTPDGVRYTRNGNFQLDRAGRLVTTQGDPVLGEKGELRAPAGDLTVADNGDVFVGDTRIDRLRMRDFEAPEALQRDGAGLCAADPAARPVAIGEETKVCPGCLERSNVQGIDGMVRMMTLMKQYEAAQRVLKLQSQTLSRVTSELIR